MAKLPTANELLPMTKALDTRTTGLGLIWTELKGFKSQSSQGCNIVNPRMPQNSAKSHDIDCQASVDLQAIPSSLLRWPGDELANEWLNDIG